MVISVAFTGAKIMLKVVHDGAPTEEPKERCCMCRAPTNWWYGKGETNVALCPECACKVKKEELPTKRERVVKEIKLNRSDRLF